MKERTLCYICGEDIVKGYVTKGDDEHYYCAKCLIDLNRWKNHLEILYRRKKELEEQLNEINLVLENEKERLLNEYKKST